MLRKKKERQKERREEIKKRGGDGCKGDEGMEKIGTIEIERER